MGDKIENTGSGNVASGGASIDQSTGSATKTLGYAAGFVAALSVVASLLWWAWSNGYLSVGQPEKQDPPAQVDGN